MSPYFHLPQRTSRLSRLTTHTCHLCIWQLVVCLVALSATSAEAQELNAAPMPQNQLRARTETLSHISWYPPGVIPAKRSL